MKVRISTALILCAGIGLALFAAWKMDREGYAAMYTGGLMLFYLGMKARA